MDIRVENHGTVFLFLGESAEGMEWLSEHIGHSTRWGAAYAVEHRYAWDIAQGALNDGMSVE